MTAEALADHILTLMDKNLNKRWKAYKVQELIDLYTKGLEASGVCLCSHGEGHHLYTLTGDPKQSRYDCNRCACEEYRPSVADAEQTQQRENRAESDRRRDGFR